MADRIIPVGPFLGGLNTRDNAHRIGHQHLTIADNVYIEDDRSIKSRLPIKTITGTGALTSINGLAQFEDRGVNQYNFLVDQNDLKLQDKDGTYFKVQNSGIFSIADNITFAELVNFMVIADEQRTLRQVSFERPDEIFVVDNTNDQIVVFGGTDVSNRRVLGPAIDTETLLNPLKLTADALHYYVLDDRGATMRLIKFLKSNDTVVTATNVTVPSTNVRYADIDIQDTILYYVYFDGTTAAIERRDVSDITTITGTTTHTVNGPANIRPTGIAVEADDTAGLIYLAAQTTTTAYMVSYKTNNGVPNTTTTDETTVTLTPFPTVAFRTCSVDELYVYTILDAVGADQKNKIYVFRKNDLAIGRTVDTDDTPGGIMVDDAVIYQTDRANNTIRALIKRDVTEGRIPIRATISTLSMGDPEDVGFSRQLTVDVKDVGSPEAPEAEAVAPIASGITGTHKHCMTFIETRGETSCGKVSNSVSPSAQDIRIDRIPKHIMPDGTSSPVIDRRLYRTLNGGTEFFRLNTGIILEPMRQISPDGAVIDVLSPLAADDGPAGAVNAGTHTWAVSFAQTVNGVLMETDLTIFQSGSRATLDIARDVPLSSIPVHVTKDGSTSPVTGRFIYRTIATDPNTLYRIPFGVADFVTPSLNDNTTTEATDVTADAAIFAANVQPDFRFIDNETDAVIALRERAPLYSATAPVAKMVVRYKDRIFAVDRRRPDEIQWTLPFDFVTSVPGSELYFPNNNYATIGSDRSPITALWIQGDVLFISTEDRIFPFSLQTDLDIALGAPVVDHTGVVGPRAVTVVESIAYLVGRFGAYSFDGVRAILISDKITPTLSFSFNNNRRMCFVVRDIEFERILFFFPQGGTLNPGTDTRRGAAVWFVYDYEKSDYRSTEAAIWTRGFIGVLDDEDEEIKSAVSYKDSTGKPTVVMGDLSAIRHLERGTFENGTEVIVQTGFIPVDGGSIGRAGAHKLIWSQEAFAADAIKSRITTTLEQARSAKITEPSHNYDNVGTAGGIKQQATKFTAQQGTSHVRFKWDRNTDGFTTPQIDLSPLHIFDAAFAAERAIIGQETQS